MAFWEHGAAYSRRSHRPFLAGACLAALSAGQAWAQSGEAVPLGTLRVGGEGAEGFTIAPPKEKGYRASRSISATKTDTELRDTPQAVTVVTRQQIEDQAIQSMGDALRYVPGASLAQGEGNRDTPVLRGNASTADFFVDGIRDDVQYIRDVYNLERIEVLKGPNAMIFGRGGSGGVINRVTRQADWAPTREVRLEAGSDEHYRATFDIGQGVADGLALRLTGVYEDSRGFRDGFELRRWGLNPSATVRFGEDTLLTVNYEHFDDERVADRGVPSFNGRPLPTDPSTFFGDPSQSPVRAEVDQLTANIEHRFGAGLVLRNRTRFADYDKFYQNVFPGAVNAAGTLVRIEAYNNGTQRNNLINQTDLIWYGETGSIRHTLLFGAELGRQETDNLRKTGFFTAVSPTTTFINVPVTSPNIRVPVTFAPNATDASNHGVVKFAAGYIQDQIEFNPKLSVVLGVRYDSFKVDFVNNRTGARIETDDNLWSPRAGLIFKPIEALSLYASYSKTYLPRSGDQLSSLTPTNAAFDPEEFENYEIGLKWDPLADLSLTAAVYQLDRSNVVVADPTNPAVSVLVDGQRTKGVELSASGRITEKWSIVAAYAYQDAELTATASATAQAGATLPNTPKHSFAVWNRYDLTDALGLGLGLIHQGKRFASTDNLVTLADYTRVDGAVFYDIKENVSVQLNVENLLDEEYFVNAHSNNNLSPGSPRAFKVALSARF